MILLVLLLQTAAAVPTPTATPAAVVRPSTDPSRDGSYVPKPLVYSAPIPMATAAGPQSLTDAARGRKLNHGTPTAGGFSASHSGAGTTLDPETGKRVPAAPRPASTVENVQPSSDEAMWRGRVTRLRTELTKAQKELDSASANNTVVAWGNPGRDYELMMAARNAALTPYRVKVDALQTELESLPEECRHTSGCAAGWVR